MAELDEARARAVLVEMQERVIRGPHAALDVPMHATQADIRHAFLELTKIYHPARFGRMSTELQRLSNEVFLSLRAAHDALAKPKVRSTGPILPSNTATTSPRATTAQMPTIAHPPGAQPPATHPAGAHPSNNNAHSTGTHPAAHPRPGTGQQPVVPARPTNSPRTANAPPPVRMPSGSPPPGRVPTPPLGVRTVAPPSTRATTPAMGVRIAQPAKPVPAAQRTMPLPKLGDDPELATIHDLMQRGQWNEARAAITTLSAKAPASPKYRALLAYTRGREAQLAGERDEARVELDTALQLDPDLQLAKTALAELFTRRK